MQLMLGLSFQLFCIVNVACCFFAKDIQDWLLFARNLLQQLKMFVLQIITFTEYHHVLTISQWFAHSTICSILLMEISEEHSNVCKVHSQNRSYSAGCDETRWKSKVRSMKISVIFYYWQMMICVQFSSENHSTISCTTSRLKFDDPYKGFKKLDRPETSSM